MVKLTSSPLLTSLLPSEAKEFILRAPYNDGEILRGSLDFFRNESVSVGLSDAQRGLVEEARKNVEGNKLKKASEILINMFDGFDLVGWRGLVSRFCDPAAVFSRIQLSRDLATPQGFSDGMDRIIAELPPYFLSPNAPEDAPTNNISAKFGMLMGMSEIELISAGHLFFPRLNAIHYLIAQLIGARDLVAVDNGPGMTPEVTISLTNLGCRVIVKELADCIDHHKSIYNIFLNEDRKGLVTHVDPSKIHETTPANIVYWTDPSEEIKVPDGMDLFEYMSRDLILGGILVIQTDHNEGGLWDPRAFYLHMCFDPTKFKMLYDSDIRRCPVYGHGRSNYVLPTIQGDLMHLQLYRRIG